MIMKVDISKANKEIKVYISDKVEYEEVFDLIDGLENAFIGYTINLVGESPSYITYNPGYIWNNDKYIITTTNAL